MYVISEMLVARMSVIFTSRGRHRPPVECGVIQTQSQSLRLFSEMPGIES